MSIVTVAAFAAAAGLTPPAAAADGNEVAAPSAARGAPGLRLRPSSLSFGPGILQPEPGQKPPEDKADDGSVDLAKKLANPIADLISIPIQFNYDEGYGPQSPGHEWITPVVETPAGS